MHEKILYDCLSHSNIINTIRVDNMEFDIIYISQKKVTLYVCVYDIVLFAETLGGISEKSNYVLAVVKVFILWFSANIFAIIFSFVKLSLGHNHYFYFIKQETVSGLNFWKGGII